jgi:hypothetical protein
MVSRSPSQIVRSITASMSSLMVLRVVATVRGESGWQLDWGQSGSVGEKTPDTLQLAAGSSMDILMLDIVVIVVLAEDVVTEIGVFKSMCVCQMTMAAGFELVKFVGCIWGIANEGG